jgi:electron transfer flavoprotein alpha subunit
LEPGTIEKLALEMAEQFGIVVTDRRSAVTMGKDLSEAARVVAGGRGMGAPENFKLIENLADVLDAAVGASRAVVDAGWRPHDEQVGKSGRTISPDLYIACGISGAIHHTLGMNTSKVVAAINSDPDALIFQHADFGLVGDALKILPELVEAFKSGQGG